MITDNSTLTEVRTWLDQQDDTECPCCTGRVKTYNRNLPQADLPALVSLYMTTQKRKLAGELGDIWVHISDLQGKSGGGDFAKFRFWDFIVAKPNEDDPSKKDSGLWRILPVGVAFLTQGLEVPKKMLFRMNVSYGAGSDVLVTFSTANPECAFHFGELMASR